MSKIDSAIAPKVSADGYLEKNDYKKYSLSRLIKKIVYPKTNQEDWTIETEISKNLKLKYSDETAKYKYLIPPFSVGVRAVSTDNTGANLIAKSQGADLFNYAPEPQSRVIKAGARVVTGLKNRYEICGSDRPFTAYYVNERDIIPESRPNFSKIPMQPHKIGCLCTLTVEMLNQTPELADRYIANGLQRALARKIDETVFTGTGIDQPLGIISHPNVNSVVLGTEGDFLDWVTVVEMSKLVTDNNPINEETLCYFVNSATAETLKRTQKVAGSSEFVMTDQPFLPLDDIKILNSRRAIVTNNLPKNLVKGSSSNLSMAVFGDWSQVVIGFWGAIGLDIDPYSKGNFDRGLVTIRALAQVDIAFLNPQLFCVATDVKTSQ